MNNGTSNAVIQQILESVGGTVPDEEKPAISNDFAAWGSMLHDHSKSDEAPKLSVGADNGGVSEAAALPTSRESLYNTLRNPDNSDLEARKQDILKKMGSGEPMSKSQVAGMLLIGVLPMLLGGALKGKKGLAAGAAAGAIGTQFTAKAMEDEAKRTQQTGLSLLKDVDAEQRARNTVASQADMQTLKAADTSAENVKDRENAQTVAGIRASGEVSASRELGNSIKEAKLEQITRENESTAAPIVVQGRAFIPTTKVKTKDADAAKTAASHYMDALTNIQSIVEKSKSMDFPAFQRSLGDTSSDLHQKFVLAQNAIMAAKKIPGLKGTDAIKNLDSFVESPTGLLHNLYKSIPGTSSIVGDYSNAYKNLNQNFNQFMKLNNYETISPGQEVTMNGKTFRVGRIYEDGTFDPAE